MRDIEKIGMARQNAHPIGTRRLYTEDGIENITGALGEDFVAELLGLDMDTETRPNGDGGVDMRVTLNGINTTIDVKTCLKWPHSLPVKLQDMGRCADFVVLVFVPADSRAPLRVVGWDTRDVIARAPIQNLGLGQSRCQPVNMLRPFWQLKRMVKEWARRTS